MKLLPIWLALALALAGCGGAAHRPTLTASNVPPFARVPYEPFNRDSVVAIALREWRLFGSPVDDDPPGSRPDPVPDAKPERMAGLWQRVGEYWWAALPPDAPEAAWTGRHDERGLEFPASADGDFAWSAAFVSYVMRIAGAGDRFPYARAHHEYIDAAKRVATGAARNLLITAERPEAYAPRVGDLICVARGSRRPIYDSLPAGPFPAHCDFVVDAQPGALSVIGGNVDDAVTLKHVPVGPDGRLTGPDARILDPRYTWFVVLRVLYPEAAPVA